MQTNSSLPFSPQPNICPYHEQCKSILRISILDFPAALNIILLFTRNLQSVTVAHLPPTTTRYALFTSHNLQHVQNISSV